MNRPRRVNDGYQFQDAVVRINPLSHREAQLLVIKATGASHKEAAAIMGIKPSSAAKVANNIYYKLSCNRITAALSEGRRRGIIHYFLLVLAICSAFQTGPEKVRPPHRIIRIPVTKSAARQNGGTRNGTR